MHSVGVVRAASRLARLRPEQVKRIRFGRAKLGRRGLAEEQVYAFLRAVVDELIARDGVEAGLRAENTRLKTALRRWQGNFTPEPSRMGNAGRGARLRSTPSEFG